MSEFTHHGHAAISAAALNGTAFPGAGFGRRGISGAALRAEQLSDEALFEYLHAFALEPDCDAERDALVSVITRRMVETYGCDDSPVPRVRMAD